MTKIVPVPKSIDDLHPLDRRLFGDAGVQFSADSWANINGDDFRLWPLRGCLRLWRKTYHPGLYGGHQIHTVVADSRLAREWIESSQARA